MQHLCATGVEIVAPLYWIFWKAGVIIFNQPPEIQYLFFFLWCSKGLIYYTLNRTCISHQHARCEKTTRSGATCLAELSKSKGGSKVAEMVNKKEKPN